MKKNISFVLFLLLSAIGGLNLLFSLTSCNTTEPPIIPPPDLRKITLTIEDASCTEVWLKIKSDSLTFPAEVKLLIDAGTQNLIIATKDTVLYIDSLLPNQTYNYQVVLCTDTTIKSEKVTAQTLEPTSHNFTWQSWEFGQHSNSVLYDVAIIDENNIWAVGEIYMNDSLGNPDPNAYNAVHWDGQQWELKRIYFPTFCPQTADSGSYPATSIFVFNDGNIIVGSGSSFAVVRENMQYRKYCVPVSINKIWGSSINDFYFVGYGGGIAHATATQFGYNFTKIESGTTSNINDIWGEVDELTSEIKILCAATDRMLRINSNNQVDSLNYFSSRTVFSIWFKGKHKFFSSGDGVFINTNNKWQEQNQLPYYYTYTIRGSEVNNVFVGGAFGLAAHYNGVSWQRYTELTFSSGRYIGISVKANKVCFVGRKGAKAIIVLNN